MPNIEEALKLAHAMRERGHVNAVAPFIPVADALIDLAGASDLTAAQERIRLLEGAIEGAPHSEPCNHFRCACSVCGVVVTDHPDFMVMVGDELIPTGVCEGFHWIAGKCNCWKSVLAPKETTDGR